jgi:DnaJ-class molecular chaperone
VDGPSGRDHYAVLRVARDADQETIRRAYRALVTEHHPDVSGDPDADDRFRELTDAYYVLSRPESRRRYDILGFDPRGLGGLDAARDATSRPGATAMRSPMRGDEVRVELHLTPAQALAGGRCGVRYQATTACESCLGTDDGCEDCHGSRVLVVDRASLVEVPPRSVSGRKIRVGGAGAASPDAGMPGDLIVTVQIVGEADRHVRFVAAGGGILAVLLLIALFFGHRAGWL